MDVYKSIKSQAQLCLKVNFFRLIQNKICDDVASDLADAFRSNSALTHLMYDTLNLSIIIIIIMSEVQ